MPPIEKAPRSFFASPDSEEAKQLHERTLDGEFEKEIELIVVDINNENHTKYLLFQHPGDNAVDAFEVFGPGGTYIDDERVRLDRTKPIFRKILEKAIGR